MSNTDKIMAAADVLAEYADHSEYVHARAELLAAVTEQAQELEALKGALKSADAIDTTMSAEIDRLRQELEAAKKLNKGWLKENGPDGWIDNLRKERDALQAKKQMLLTALQQISGLQYHIERPPIYSLEEQMRKIADAAIFGKEIKETS